VGTWCCEVTAPEEAAFALVYYDHLPQKEYNWHEKAKN
jgi:hypothetical protein